MTFQVIFEHIPYRARENFLTECGRYEYLSSYDFNKRREHELSKFKGKRCKNYQDILVYEFESEANYHWFLLRWS
jgi:hypothetical protein